MQSVTIVAVSKNIRHFPLYFFLKHAFLKKSSKWAWGDGAVGKSAEVHTDNPGSLGGSDKKIMSLNHLVMRP